MICINKIITSHNQRGPLVSSVLNHAISATIARTASRMINGAKSEKTFTYIHLLLPFICLRISKQKDSTIVRINKNSYNENYITNTGH